MCRNTFVMKKITIRRTIETDPLIYYVTDGMSDDSTKKLILYGA